MILRRYFNVVLQSLRPRVCHHRTAAVHVGEGEGEVIDVPLYRGGVGPSHAVCLAAGQFVETHLTTGQLGASWARHWADFSLVRRSQ